MENIFRDELKQQLSELSDRLSPMQSTINSISTIVQVIDERNAELNIKPSEDCDHYDSLLIEEYRICACIVEFIDDMLRDFNREFNEIYQLVDSF